MRIYWINEFKTGNLGMMARPKGNDWLESEVQKLSLNDVDTVVSFLERHEEAELELKQEAFFCEKANINFISFPIPDRGTPEKKNEYLDLIARIVSILEEDKKAVLHCRMGIGRTSMVAAGVLIKYGVNPDLVFDVLSEKRTIAVPDTYEQIDWVLNLKEDI